MRSIMSPVDHFLALSHELRRRFVAFGVPEDRISWAAQGIEQHGYEGLVRTAGDRLRIGFFGSLMISKAPHVLLEAFSMLPEGAASLDVYGAHAGYHGDQSYRSRIEPLLSLPGVRYHGAVAQDAVPPALASLDVVVVPSTWLENCPLVIREAFVAGVPVVASNLGGMAEMVRHEHNGLLFEPGDADALRRTLLRLIQEPALIDRLRAGRPRVGTIVEDGEAAHALYEGVNGGNGRRPRPVQSAQTFAERAQRV
jgi:glycosyltransferase involved in cell wall biosynthesis